MENSQMFVPDFSMPIFHALNKNNTSFDNGDGSNLNLLMENNMVPRMFQVAGNTDHRHQEQVASPNYTGNYSASGLESLEETTGKMEGAKNVKKPKYAFQTRSHIDVLDDGYRWRKYGQKTVKNNKFPRNYYKCTHQGCNVKKQVQRLTRDAEVVVTTYEGTHTHPVQKSTENFEHILSQMQIYPLHHLIN